MQSVSNASYMDIFEILACFLLTLQLSAIRTTHFSMSISEIVKILECEQHVLYRRIIESHHYHHILETA